MTVWCTNYFSYQYYHDEQSFPFSLCFIHSGGAQNAEMFILEEYQAKASTGVRVKIMNSKVFPLFSPIFCVFGLFEKNFFEYLRG